jgi:hypothetical protein
MATERKGGPVAMSEEELAAFVAGRPTGAICVIDDNGHLLALPGRVVDYRDTLTVEIDGADPDARQSCDTPACLVADTFPSYQAIRGIISQGSIAWPPTSHDVVVMTITRTVTFSFANA